LRRIDEAGRGGAWATEKAKNTLKKPLLELTWGKCAFCEGRLGAQAYAQIEHYISRKVDRDRAFEWKNLLPVCQVCNRSKGHSDHQGSLLKPDAEDPEPFFWIGPEGDITPHPSLNADGTFRASETIRLCGLDRGALRDDRLAVANFVRRWLARTSGLVGGLDETARAEWKQLSDPHQSYKLVVRHVLTQENLPGLAARDRRLYHRKK